MHAATPKRRLWPKLLAGIGVVGLAIATLAAAGGFNEASFVTRTATVGETVDLGPWELSVHRAWVAEKWFDEKQFDATILGMCRNTTQTGESHPNYLRTSIIVLDPVTKQNARNLSLYVGAWDEPLSLTDALNPSAVPIPCRLVATFYDGFSDSDVLRLGLLPVSSRGNLFSSVDSLEWYYNTMHPFELLIPLEPPPE
ncbi:MAG: hypothetical protein FWG47_00955 [Propionibacteriaceae bacterium]|nr:hypothetical protein [Propionibacteriaceae bacterium]